MTFRNCFLLFINRELTIKNTAFRNKIHDFESSIKLGYITVYQDNICGYPGKFITKMWYISETRPFTCRRCEILPERNKDK
jgi:hypothetical protein